MSHARVEELSDSDPDIDDPSDFLPQSDNHIIRAADIPSTSTSSRPAPPHTSATEAHPMNPNLLRAAPPPNFQTRESVERQREAIRHYCTIYPCYFSSRRTRSQGRRVPKNLATPDPLAYNLLMAVQQVIQPDRHRIHIAFEPDKTHPKDWANPGRVRVHLYDRDTHAALHPTIKSKEHLFVEVARFFKEHPTQKSDTLEMKIAGLPVPDKFLETEVPRPRGWVGMNAILPVHSPAVSGGGVRDDFFKEAMEELRQAQGGAGGADGGMAGLQSMMSGLGGMGGMGGMGLPGMGGGSSAGESSGKKKKDKKKG